jgi:hypothetical protein
MSVEAWISGMGPLWLPGPRDADPQIPLSLGRDS